MKLPVGIIQASLEMVRSRIAQQFPSEAAVIAQVIDALNPSANALRVRKHRAKPVMQNSVTSNVSGNAQGGPTPPLSDSPSDLSISAGSEASEEKEESEEDEIESARGEARNAKRNAESNAPRNAKSSVRVTRWTSPPVSFEPSPDARALAATLGVNIDVELAKFRDHEYAKPKTDADKAFRTWLRNAAEWGSSARPANRNFKDLSRPQARLLTHAEHAQQAASQQLPDWAKG